LPFSTDSNTLIFSKIASDGSLWAPLMEKVWAKVGGNYDLIVGGTATDVYNFMLGCPV
jgi:hypothetical protein